MNDQNVLSQILVNDIKSYAKKTIFEKNLYSYVQQSISISECAILTHFQFQLDQAVFFNLVSSSSKIVNQLLIGP